MPRKIFLSVVGFISLLLVGFPPQALFASLAQKTILEKAQQEEEAFRCATWVSLKDLMQTIVVLGQNKSLTSFQTAIEHRVTADEAFINKLDQNLHEKKNNEPKFRPGENVSFPFYYHKLREALTGARSLLKDHLGLLLSGKVPDGYTYQQSTATLLGDNPKTIFGNPKGTYLKTALFYIVLALDPPVEGSFIKDFKGIQAELSPCFHRTPWPAQLDPADYKGFSFLMTGDEAWPTGYLFFPHSGYAFGGDRENPRTYFPKISAPEDCSSAVAKWVGLPPRLDTLSLLYWYRSTKEPEGSFIDPAWHQNSLVKNLICLKPVTVNEPSDIQPGDLHLIRKFSFKEDPSMTRTPGVGGHVSVVVQVNSNLVKTIGYARDLENGIEGLGLKDFSIFSCIEPTNGLVRKIMFFRIQKD